MLVGSLYSLPPGYVHFEHEPPACITSYSDPFHVVKTLKPRDNPLAVRDRMLEHLLNIQTQAPAGPNKIAPKV